MRIIHIACIVAAGLAFSMLTDGPGANAQGGWGARGPSAPRGLRYTFQPRNLLGRHQTGRFDHRFNRWPFYGNGTWPLYGGLYAVPPYDIGNDIVTGLTERVVFVPVPPSAITCKRSVETVTVQAEAGGTRDITVTRC